MKRVAILGLGKAGGALAASFGMSGIAVVAASSRSAARRAAFHRRFGAPSSPSLEALLEDARAAKAEALFLAVPDDALDDVARRLVRATWTPRITAHLSGARGVEALGALRGAATFHPLAALDGRSPVPAGTLVAIDADDERGEKALLALARRIGGAPVHVSSSQRVRYHAGAVTAANLAVALLAFGVELLVEAGVDDDTARGGLALLLRSTADGALARPLPASMTGPVARGDAKTIEKHLDVLRERPELLAVYRALSEKLVDIADLPATDKARIRGALSGKDAAPSAAAKVTSASSRARAARGRRS